MKEKIKNWKEKYGEDSIYEIIVDKEGEKISGYFRKPTLKIISAASKVKGIDEIKAGLILFDNCWLEGDERILKNDELKVSCLSKLNELFKVYESEVKKL